ncbi:DUF4145 domain-containing protein [Bacillus sp. EB01]|uniref:DUF4145 domain-containing protein n=1 Tax=Bacillus sp. EB01 TaxID=1347086 RepID=UPI0005C65003|nr:DUF4145 domain-containing protein [Bacillus sp. EB01]
MGYRQGAFEFVGSFSNELLTLIVQLEEALFTQPQTVLMQARLYTEQLVKLVSKEEGIENVYPLKHAERIHKLYRQNAIEEDLYIKLEWIRKKGNKAAHDVSAVSIEDGLKAHKYLFDISVWYMQVYVSYDFEAPIYKLPVPEKGSGALSEQELSVLIKPYLEQSFKQMDEMKKEIQRELDELKRIKDNAISSTIEETEVEKEVVSFSLLNYLEEKQIPYIDNRTKNGALWVIGGWELNEKLFPLKENRIYFRFMKKGGRATNYKPGWFLLNKNLNDPKVEKVAGVNEVETKYDVPNGVEEHPVKPEPITAIQLEKVAAGFWRKAGQLLIPTTLFTKDISEFPLDGLKRLQQHTSIQKLGDLTEEHLRDIYKSSRDDFHAVLEDLFWLGFRFDGRLASFQPLSATAVEHQIVVAGHGEEDIRQLLSPLLAKKFLDKQINKLIDLHGYLGQSIKWLTKMEAEKVVAQIEGGLQSGKNYDQETSKVHEHPHSESRIVNTKNAPHLEEPYQEGTLELSFQGEKMTVRSDLARMRIDELGILGCNNMIRQLIGLGMISLRDFPHSLDGLHLRLISVGERTIRKFWDQVGEKNGQENVPELPAFDSEGNKLVYFYSKTLVIPKYLMDFPIRKEDFPFAEKAVDGMAANGMEKVGELPTQFEEIGNVEGAGKKRVQMIFDKLTSLIELANQHYQLQQLPLNERLALELASYENWMTRLMEDEDFLKAEKISPRYLDLMQRRYNAMLSGTHLTLEVLGEQEGVTRERIRQILQKGDIRVARRIRGLIAIIKQLVEESAQFFSASFLDRGLFSHYILTVTLEEAGLSIVSVNDSMFLSLLDKEKIEDYKIGIKKELEEVFSLHVITPTDFMDFCQDKGKEDGVNPEFIEKTAEQHVNWLNADQGLLKGMRKFQAVEMVMLQYPNGVEVYKREEELLEKANDLMPGEFTGERDFYAIATRADVSDRILLWGRGVYIHSSFVTTDSEWVQSVERLAHTMLESEEFIHVRKLYDAVIEEAEKRKVPNEYALYTLLRKYSTGLVTMTKFPYIQPEGSVRRANADYIEQFIRDKGGSVQFDELYELFVEKRGWKRFTLELNLSSNEQFVQYKYGHYTLLSLFDHIQLDQIPFVVQAIHNNLEESPLISIHSVFMEHEVVLKSMGIESKQILYAILRNRGVPHAIFAQYPYILKPGHKIDSLSGTRYIEQFILERDDIVAREEVMEWVETVFGGDERILDITLSKVPEILYYAKGQFGEYVHKQTIGLTQEKEEILHQAIKKRLPEVMAAKGRDYALVSDIFDETMLPELDKGIFWTSDLLEDVIKKSGKWTVLGSYNEVILPLDSPIKNEVDFVEYILSHHFNGAAKVNELLRFLTDIRYSSGKMLFAVEEALKNGEAPFMVDGDEIMLKSLILGGTKGNG